MRRVCFPPVMLTVTGLSSPSSITRRSSQLSCSNSKGRSWHQPWLSAVRLKLKLCGTGIEISMSVKVGKPFPKEYGHHRRDGRKLSEVLRAASRGRTDDL